MSKEDFIKILNEKIEYYHKLEMKFEDVGDIDRAEQNFWKWMAIYNLKHEIDDVKGGMNYEKFNGLYTQKNTCRN